MTPKDLQEFKTTNIPKVEVLRSKDGFKKESVAIPRWMVAGCFQGSIDESLIDEGKIDPNQIWSAPNGKIYWKDNTCKHLKATGGERIDEQVNAVMFNKKELNYQEEFSCASIDTNVTGNAGIVYLASYIYSRALNQYWLITEYNRPYKIILNGKEIYSNCKYSYEPNIKNINLLHGWNLLMIKLDHKESNGFYGGICDLQGRPFKDGWIKSGFMEGNDIDTQLFGKNPSDTEKAIEIGYAEHEYKRTNPDSVVYIPKEGPEHNDGDNEHFLVFNAPKSHELIAIWTQGSMEPSGDNHIVTARSKDGVTWSQPQWIYGTRKDTYETQASWAFPVVASKTGRIYCFYCESKAGQLGGSSGVLGCHISDDNGKNWKRAGRILFPDCFENINDIATQNGSIIVWQKTIRDSNGEQIVGYSFSGKACTSGSCRFMRFDNIDDGPDLEDLKIEWLSLEGDTISMPDYLENRHCSEPAIVLLPDKRLLTVFRTATGNIWYSVSENDGINWTKPRVLRYSDKGKPVKNPLACCPLYKLEDGHYMLIYFNNSYYADIISQRKPLPAGMSIFTHRRPAFYSIGRFMPEAEQPLWFDQPVEMLDNEGIIVSPKASNEVATYPSITYFNNQLTLWYPDRKYFLLGKHLCL